MAVAVKPPTAVPKAPWGMPKADGQRQKASKKIIKNCRCWCYWPKADSRRLTAEGRRTAKGAIIKRLQFFLILLLYWCFYPPGCFYPHWSRESLSPVCGIFWKGFLYYYISAPKRNLFQRTFILPAGQFQDL